MFTNIKGCRKNLWIEQLFFIVKQFFTIPNISLSTFYFDSQPCYVSFPWQFVTINQMCYENVVNFHYLKLFLRFHLQESIQPIFYFFVFLIFVVKLESLKQKKIYYEMVLSGKKWKKCPFCEGQKFGRFNSRWVCYSFLAFFVKHHE